MVILTAKPQQTKTGSPVSIEAAKRQLQIEAGIDDDDEQITDLIEVAIDQVESDCNADLLLTENTLEYEIEGSTQSRYRICCAPLKEVTKIEAITGETTTEIESSKYKVTDGFNWFTIELLESVTAAKLKFTFKTGYDDAACPKKLRQAALVMLTDLFDSWRQGHTLTSVSENKAYTRLLSGHIRNY